MSLNQCLIKAPAYTSSRGPENKSRRVVLFVDDHCGSESSLTQFLKHREYQLLDTDNGQDAIRLANKVQPDVLVVDLDVPLLYELVAARQIVKRAQLGTIPVLVLTHEETIDPAPIIELGVRMNEFISRLSDFEKLERFFDNFFEGFVATI